MTDRHLLVHETLEGIPLQHPEAFRAVSYTKIFVTPHPVSESYLRATFGDAYVDWCLRLGRLTVLEDHV